MFLMERYQNKVSGKGKSITKTLHRAKLYKKSDIIIILIIVIIKIIMITIMIIIVIIIKK